MIRDVKRSVIIYRALLVLAFVLCSCRMETDSRTNAETPAATVQTGYLNLDPKVQYVGDEDCALCHAEIFKSFTQTGMGRSFYPPTASTRFEDVTNNNHVYDARSNFHYEVIAKGEDLYQVEYRLDEKQRRTHELARKVDYVVGSGNHARTYITAENGFLYEMPLTWYTQKKSWGLSPGYAYFNHRFSRPIIAGCMNCHNSYAEYVPYSGNRYNEVPRGIGCERCHGPGELHVEKRYNTKFADSTKKDIDYTIVNPRRLPPARQMDVCFQCHLQGVAAILKPGKRINDFRPGMRLQDVRSVYVLDHLPVGDLRVASHAERMARSACFLNSGGQLTCITCHNPHQPVKTVARSSFNETCVRCHELAKLSLSNPRAQHHAAGDCVACHMPQGKTVDVVHVNFTDHWIQKEHATPRTTHANAPPTLKDFFAEKDAAADLRLGMAYLQFYDVEYKDPVYFERALALLRDNLHSDPENEEGVYRLGLAYFYRGRLEEARQQFRALTKIAPDHALAHLQHAMVLHEMKQQEEAVAAYSAALRLFPDNAAALTQLGNLYVQMKKPQAALDCFQKASAAQPSYAPAHNALGEFFAYQQQAFAKAKPHFLRAVNLEPDYVPALNNLGVAAMAASDYPQAIKFFGEVLARDSKFIPAYGNLAFIHSLQGRNEEAKKYLKRALAVEPGNARLKDMLEQIESAEKIGMN